MTLLPLPRGRVSPTAGLLAHRTPGPLAHHVRRTPTRVRRKGVHRGRRRRPFERTPALSPRKKERKIVLAGRTARRTHGVIGVAMATGDPDFLLHPLAAGSLSRNPYRPHRRLGKGASYRKNIAQFHDQGRPPTEVCAAKPRPANARCNGRNRATFRSSHDADGEAIFSLNATTHVTPSTINGVAKTSRTQTPRATSTGCQ
jgi:hypothetical protein